MLKIIIATENAAFVDKSKEHEVARILDSAAKLVASGLDRPMPLQDINGNTVGVVVEGEGSDFYAANNFENANHILLSMDTDNAAFEYDRDGECARIIKEAAGKVRNGDFDFKLRDVNGNSVGKVEEGSGIKRQKNQEAWRTTKVMYEKPGSEPVRAPRQELSFYSALKSAGIEMDSHASDLYVPVTPESTAILAKYPDQQNTASTFLSAIDGRRHYDVPFAFEPYWEKGSLNAAVNIANTKQSFLVANPTEDKKFSGNVMGVTDHHFVLSLGRTALVVEKRDVFTVPESGQTVDLIFSNGRGVVDVVQAKEVER